MRYHKKLLIGWVGLFSGFVFLFLPLIDKWALTALLERERGCVVCLARLGEEGSEIRETRSRRWQPGVLTLFGCVLFLYSSMLWMIVSWCGIPLQRLMASVALYKKKAGGRDCWDSYMKMGEFQLLNGFLQTLIRQLKEQEEQCLLFHMERAELLDFLQEGILIVNACGCVTFSNAAANRLLGVDRDRLQGNLLDPLATDRKELTTKCFEVIQQTLQTREAHSRVWDSLYRDRLYIRLTAIPCLRQGGAVLILQDNTSDCQVLEMGKDFIANASHELRTPITIIRGFAETLQEHPSLPAETRSQIAGKIVHTSARFEKVLKSLLTLAHLEQFHSDKLQYVDLIPLAEGCRNLLITAHPEARVNLSTNLLHARIAADPQLMDLAIMNLLENAITYSKFPAQIEILIYTQDAEVRLEVRDQGIGIPEADLPQIFNRFYTVDKNRSRKAGGAGLGLSIVKMIIGKHGGVICAASQIGIGSVFTLALPLSGTQQQDAVEICRR